MEQQEPISADRYVGGLVTFVYRASRQYLSWALPLALAVGALTYFSTPAATSYEGQALIQLGAADSKSLIGVETIAAGVNAQSFRQRVMKELNSGDVRSNQIVSETLNAQVDGPDTMTVGVRAPASEPCRKAFEVIVRLLAEREAKLREPLLASLKRKLEATDAYLADLSKLEEQIAALTKPPARPSRSSEPTALGAVILFDLMAKNQREQFIARAEKLELQTRLGPTSTYPVHLVDDSVAVSEVTSAGRPWRTGLLVAVITLCLIMLFAMSGRSSSDAAGRMGALHH